MICSIRTKSSLWKDLHPLTAEGYNPSQRGSQSMATLVREQRDECWDSATVFALLREPRDPAHGRVYQ